MGDSDLGNRECGISFECPSTPSHTLHGVPGFGRSTAILSVLGCSGLCTVLYFHLSQWNTHTGAVVDVWLLLLLLLQASSGTGSIGSHPSGLKEEVTAALRALRDNLLAEERGKEVSERER